MGSGVESWDNERFVDMPEEVFRQEIVQARRRMLGELLRPERLSQSSTSQVHNSLRLLEEMYPEPEEQRDERGFFLDTMLIADGFCPIRRDILEQRHREYLLPGGRGSTKSSFVSLMLVELLMRTEELHVLVLRQVAATLRDSVYAQMVWAIRAAGLENEFDYTPGAPEICRRATGQRVYFRGADDATKLKSIKPPFGAIGAVWFEELDQFAGEEAIRSVEQSAIRGSLAAGGGVVFKSFNPPRHKSHWVNRYAARTVAGRRVYHSSYESALVPKEWLGTAFLERAELLRQSDAGAYEHEYGGVANLAGGMVFENLVLRELGDEEVAAFDYVYNGVDWGWYPDPFAFVQVAVDLPARRLVILREIKRHRTPNGETARLVKELVGDAVVVCDSAEPKSVDDFRACGVTSQKAAKGPGSLAYSMKWLQGLAEIVIDPMRCPYAAAEFSGATWELGADGEPTGGMKDRNNHFIDAVRYATERVWGRRGQ